MAPRCYDPIPPSTWTLSAAVRPRRAAPGRLQQPEEAADQTRDHVGDGLEHRIEHGVEGCLWWRWRWWGEAVVVGGGGPGASWSVAGRSWGRSRPARPVHRSRPGRPEAGGAKASGDDAHGLLDGTEQRRAGHVLVQRDEPPLGPLVAEAEHRAPALGEAAATTQLGDGRADQRLAWWLGRGRSGSPRTAARRPDRAAPVGRSPACDPLRGSGSACSRWPAPRACDRDRWRLAEEAAVPRVVGSVVERPRRRGGRPRAGHLHLPQRGHDPVRARPSRGAPRRRRLATAMPSARDTCAAPRLDHERDPAADDACLSREPMTSRSPASSTGTTAMRTIVFAASPSPRAARCGRRRAAPDGPTPSRELDAVAGPQVGLVVDELLRRRSRARRWPGRRPRGAPRPRLARRSEQPAAPRSRDDRERSTARARRALHGAASSPSAPTDVEGASRTATLRQGPTRR